MPMSWAIRTVGMIGTVVWQRPFRTPGLWLPPLPGRLGRPGLLFLGLWLPPLPGRLGRPGLLFPGLWLPAIAGTVGTARIIVPDWWVPPLPGRLGRPGLLFRDCGCRHCRDGWDGPDYCSQDCGFRHCRDGWDGPDYCSRIVASPLPGRLGRPDFVPIVPTRLPAIAGTVGT